MPTIIEDFEDIPVSTNAPRVNFGGGFNGYLAVGDVNAFTFDSGLIFVNPVPNPRPALPGVLVGDFGLGDATFSLGSNGIVAAKDVPSGTAYIGEETDQGMAFAFTQKVYSVGGFFDAASGPITMTIYDFHGKEIDSYDLASDLVSSWDRNFTLLRSSKPIAAVTIDGNFVLADRLSFNTTRPEFIKGTDGADKVSGTHTVSGQHKPGAGDEVILGRGGDDKLSGLDGADDLEGGNGKDSLKGGDGFDFMNGGKGGDKMTGGADQDYFLFSASLSQAPDKIKDFSVTEDTILLDHKVFKALDFGLLPTDTFGLIIVYDAATGHLSYDPTGSGNGTHFATLSKNLALNGDEFYVI